MIPKIIHYCWFGKGDKPPMVQKSIASWRKYFPDYEIIEWNEDNFDVNQTDYMREAYSNKKWAFVSDFARLVVVYQQGGIYFDTDVEVVKNFEPLLERGGYLCFENASEDAMGKEVATGLGFAAPPQNEVILKLIQEYEGVHFLKDGEMDLTPCPARNTSALVKLGLITDGSMQKIQDMIIYPFEYFCGYDMTNTCIVRTKNTYTIHHYTASWKEKMSCTDWLKYKVVIKLLQFVLGYKGYKKVKSYWKNRGW
ncbi:MAG: glycosyl transferase [Lachnospiraceae bacterium]|nr:glycosyl transferase [Lachnospiraceae bacterium]